MYVPQSAANGRKKQFYIANDNFPKLRLIELDDRTISSQCSGIWRMNVEELFDINRLSSSAFLVSIPGSSEAYLLSSLSD